MLLRAGLLDLVSDPTIALPAALDLRTLAFVFGLTLAAGSCSACCRRCASRRPTAAAGLREGRGIAGSAAWLRVGKLVVVGQLALSLPLLVGAGLLVRTLVNLQRIDLGYPTRGPVDGAGGRGGGGYEPVRRTEAFEALLTRIRAMPGVRAATYSYNGLFGGADNGDRITVEGYTPRAAATRGSSYDAVGPGFFSTLGIPVLLGREITDQDQAGARTVCVINETFAKRFFDGRNPIGLHVTQSMPIAQHVRGRGRGPRLSSEPTSR